MTLPSKVVNMPGDRASRLPRTDGVLPRDSTSTFDVLRAYLEARAPFTDKEMDFIRTKFVPTTLRAREFLQRAGTVAKYAAFVAKGCLRSYVIDSKGKEHIVKFAPETWWVADNVSLASGTPSDYFIDALEDSDLLMIDPIAHETVVETVPGYAAAFRKGLQRHAAAKDKHCQFHQCVGAGPLPAVPEDLPIAGDAGSPMDAGVVPGRLARDDQPDPQEAGAEIAQPD